METRTERSGLTLAAILDTALQMAAAEGLESLTIGEVAKRLGLSKSGVFSRVGSREALQRAVLDEYDRRFLQDVFVPAMREPRGLPRLNAIMRLWLQRARDVEIRQGCIYCAGAFEFDDREGPLRDALLDGVMRWRAALRRTVLQAIDEGSPAARHRRRSARVRDGCAVHRIDARFTFPARSESRRPRLGSVATPRALAHGRCADLARIAVAFRRREILSHAEALLK